MPYVYAMMTLIGCLLGLRFTLAALLVAVIVAMIATPIMAVVNDWTLIHSLTVGVLLQVSLQCGYFIGVVLRARFGAT